MASFLVQDRLRVREVARPEDREEQHGELALPGHRVDDREPAATEITAAWRIATRSRRSAWWVQDRTLWSKNCDGKRPGRSLRLHARASPAHASAIALLRPAGDFESIMGCP